jgi:hypothetical protein
MMEYRISGDMQKATALADQITKGIAHELAEKIRRHPFTDMDFPSDAADLIDPEKS